MAARVPQRGQAVRARTRKLFEIEFQSLAFFSNTSQKDRLAHQEQFPGKALKGQYESFQGVLVAFTTNIRISLRSGAGEIIVKKYPYKDIGRRRLNRQLVSLFRKITLDGGFVVNSYILSNKNIPLNICMIPFKMISSNLTCIDSYISSIIQIIKCEGNRASLVWEQAPELSSAQFKMSLKDSGLAINVMQFFGLLRLRDSAFNKEAKIGFLKSLYDCLIAMRPLLGQNPNDRVLPKHLVLTADDF